MCFRRGDLYGLQRQVLIMFISDQNLSSESKAVFTDVNRYLSPSKTRLSMYIRTQHSIVMFGPVDVARGVER